MIWIFIALFFIFLAGASALTGFGEAFPSKSRKLFDAVHKQASSTKILSRRRSLLLALEITRELVKLFALALGAATLLLTPLPFWGRFGVGLALFAVYLFFAEILPRLVKESEKGGGLQKSIALFFLYLFLPISAPVLSFRKSREQEGCEEEEALEELRETLMPLLKSSKGQARLDPIDLKLLESVIQFKDLIVKEIMIPRIHLFSLDASTTIRGAASRLAEEGYSRTPVFRGSLDNIVGLLLYKDILEIYMQCEMGALDKSALDKPIESVMKAVFYTPETKKVSHLLQEFRTKQKHMAIVVDEYGGTEGVVTIEDILEEIVGPISDEYDVDEEMPYVPDPKGEGWIVDARMSIKDVEDIFEIEIPKEGDYDTLGGFIFHRMEMIPAKGSLIHEESFDLEILSASDRSVEKIRLTPKRKESP